MSSCGCFPGTKRSGWMEIRSARCLAEERALFAHAVHGNTVQRFLDTMRSRRLAFKLPTTKEQK